MTNVENDDGYWVYLKDGWKADTDPLGAEHQIHEDTPEDCAVVGIVPCGCDECERSLGRE